MLNAYLCTTPDVWEDAQTRDIYYAESSEKAAEAHAIRLAAESAIEVEKDATEVWVQSRGAGAEDWVKFSVEIQVVAKAVPFVPEEVLHA